MGYQCGDVLQAEKGPNFRKGDIRVGPRSHPHTGTGKTK